MRKTALAIVLLAALLVRCLIAGTPVNNDVSREASTAGIHLTPPPAAARAAAAAAIAPLRVALTVAVLVVTAWRLLDASGVLEVDVAQMRSLVRARAGHRRGPPALVA